MYSVGYEGIKMSNLSLLFLDLDYKAIMAEGTDVMEKLSPCLSSGNINNSAKLAKQIPDGVGIYENIDKRFGLDVIQFFSCSTTDLSMKFILL